MTPQITNRHPDTPVCSSGTPGRRRSVILQITNRHPDTPVCISGTPGRRRSVTLQITNRHPDTPVCSSGTPGRRRSVTLQITNHHSDTPVCNSGTLGVGFSSCFLISGSFFFQDIELGSVEGINPLVIDTDFVFFDRVV